MKAHFVEYVIKEDALILSPKEFGIKYGLSGGTIIRVMKDLGYSTKERIVLEISKPVEWDEFTAYLLGIFLVMVACMSRELKTMVSLT